MSLTSSMEDYLEAVLVLQKQKGYARCVDSTKEISAMLQLTEKAIYKRMDRLRKKLKIFDD